MGPRGLCRPILLGLQSSVPSLGSHFTYSHGPLSFAVTPKRRQGRPLHSTDGCGRLAGAALPPFHRLRSTDYALAPRPTKHRAGLPRAGHGRPVGRPALRWTRPARAPLSEGAAQPAAPAPAFGPSPRPPDPAPAPGGVLPRLSAASHTLPLVASPSVGTPRINQVASAPALASLRPRGPELCGRP